MFGIYWQFSGQLSFIYKSSFQIYSKIQANMQCITNIRCQCCRIFRQNPVFKILCCNKVRISKHVSMLLYRYKRFRELSNVHIFV